MYRALLMALSMGAASASSLHLAQLCRGRTCNHAAWPLMDFASGEQKCRCNAHPCWNHNGAGIKCVGLDAPFLTFAYDAAGKLKCGCSAQPFYSSTYVAKELCPGHRCEERGRPVLDYDESEGGCFCRAHPCHDVNGTRHECKDPRFPILRYREDEAAGGESAPVCECVAKLEQPRLRNAKLKIVEPATLVGNEM
mmetsp:Transcript_25403/g.67511  ORF Transcript_25403/g.67511 Transcript_25403/m.67511 type:complete len:195 (-) Transcript_25403:677-1261(-)